MNINTIPLSLYLHLPWCIKKCPYCDFNSHTFNAAIPEQDYVDTLLKDLTQELQTIQSRSIQSIFFGGGTPSLFSANAIDRILNQTQKLCHLVSDIEITLEANPGTAETNNFAGYHSAGVNRLSLGIQSFNPLHLKKLGRIHDDQEAKKAIDIARKVGFDNLNLDLMFALPEQTISQGLQDLKQAIDFAPEHISWYQLTLEPNTVFYKYPPVLPDDETSLHLQQEGQTILKEHHYFQYEVSAYAKDNKKCRHNVNYWQFGDYIGVGAGAHGKITTFPEHTITRRSKVKQPKAYLEQTMLCKDELILKQEDKIFEFMLNALRLNVPVSLALFTERTGLNADVLQPYLKQAKDKEFITITQNEIVLTDLGKQFLNDVIEIFLV